MIDRHWVCVGALLLATLVACDRSPSASDPDWEDGPTQAEPDPESDPESEPEPEPEPPPPYRLVWKTEAESHNAGVVVAPWGDVISCGEESLVVHDRKTGHALARGTFEGTAVRNGVAFVDSSTLLLASQRGLQKIVFPSLEAKTVLPFEAAEDARLAASRGDRMAVGWRDGTVRVYTLPDAKEVGVFKVEGEPNALALSPDGGRLAIGRDGTEIVLVDVAAGTRELLSSGSSSETDALSFSPDGRQLFAAVGGFGAARWDLDTGERIEEHHAGMSTKASAYLRGGWVVASGFGKLSLYRPGTKDHIPLDYEGAPRLGESIGLATFQDCDVVCASFRDGTIVCLSTNPERSAPEPTFDRSQLWANQPLPPASTRDRLQQTEPWSRSRLHSTVQSFVGEEGSKDPTAYFVRLAVLEIGGEFDVAADEEVVAHLEVDGARRRLLTETLDLPSDSLEQFTIDGVYVELVPAAAFTLGVDVLENDLTEWEDIAHTKEPLKLEAGAFKETETRRELALTTIHLTEGVLLWAEQVTIPGATATLGWIRAPRHDRRDDASRAAFREHMGAALGADLEGPADARALGAKLTSLGEAANEAAGRSVHTYVRRTLPELAIEANFLGQIARDVGALAEIPERIQALKDSGQGIPADLGRYEELVRLLRAVTESPAPNTAQEVDRLLATTVKLGAYVDRWSDEAGHPSRPLDDPIQELLKTLQLARRGAGQLGVLKTKYAALCARIQAEIDAR